MTLAEYQNFAKQNLRPGCDEVVFALGLGGETGEVLEILKKARRDLAVPDIPHIKEELGDVLWYVANLCTVFGLTLEEVIDGNVHKLCERYAKPVDFIEHAEGNYLYRMNGPHIEKIDAVTGRHIRFCARKEVPLYILKRLETDNLQAKMHQEAMNELSIKALGGEEDGRENESPFD